MQAKPYARFSGYSAILAGILVFIYSIAFVLLQNQLLYSLAQLFGGVLALFVAIALYDRLKETGEAFALAALVLSVIGAAGSALHGGYDLANAINPPAASAAALASLPSPIDPRGLLTFGMAGLGLYLFARLMTQGNKFPKSLGTLAYILALLLLLTYLAQLIILAATSPLVLVPAALTGFIANPVFNIWLGSTLLKSK